jgi:hypothetical protein
MEENRTHSPSLLEVGTGPTCTDRISWEKTKETGFLSWPLTVEAKSCQGPVESKQINIHQSSASQIHMHTNHLGRMLNWSSHFAGVRRGWGYSFPTLLTLDFEKALDLDYEALETKATVLLPIWSLDLAWCLALKQVLNKYLLKWIKENTGSKDIYRLIFW